MHWEERLLAVFDDLEQQAEGLALGTRDAELAELGRSEYAAVDLASRLHGAVGSRVRLGVRGVGALDGRLARVGSDWMLLETDPHEWLVRIAALDQVRGLGERAVDPRHRAPTARLGLGSALRGVAEERDPVLVHLLDGGTVRGTPRRVGADFVELADPDGGVVVVALGAVAGARRG
ncbi:hypothetical protein [Nocardioides iriomotensis]|uniref:Uncharacterized protein n=1 Tax=Nocardioides iriomotensis TaxID=715784 RepID=A0A4Q5J320_9ACTN|nr:hypothetical protein [Nocardioides iriomotensis]RYU12854.1 hypothetical protein ETU37_07775 [Nocardioides iriomotensis]